MAKTIDSFHSNFSSVTLHLVLVALEEPQAVWFSGMNVGGL